MPELVELYQISSNDRLPFMHGDHTTPISPCANGENQIPYTRYRKFACGTGILVFCAAFIFLVAYLPIYVILRNPPDPEKNWGTEHEAIKFAEHILFDRLDLKNGQSVDWQPNAILRIPNPPLDQSKRFWEVTGRMTVPSENPRRFHLSVAKTHFGWILVRLEENGVLLFYDDKSLAVPEYEFYDIGLHGFIFYSP